MRQIQQAFAALLLLSTTAVSPWGDLRGEETASAAEPPWKGTADAMVEKASIPGGPGGAVGVVVDGQLVYSRGFGQANLEHRVPNTPATVFDLASCSKQFTAAAVLLLAFDGKLDLFADIREILPELKLPEAVPVHRLMTHTSGLQDFSELQILGRGRSHVYTYSPDEIDALVDAQTSSCFAPGDRVLYSNTNYLLLARIVERVAGRSLREFAHERLFAPLGMTSTYFRDDRREVSHGRSTGYFRDGERFRTEIYAHERGIVGASGLQSSVEDLARWMAHFMDPDPAVGGQRLIDELTRPGVLNDGTEIDMARGLAVGKMRGQRWVEHAGHSNVNNSLMTWWRDAEVATIVLTNESSINPWGITNPLIREVLGDRLAAEPSQAQDPVEAAPAAGHQYLTLDPVQMQRYTGTYPADFEVGAAKPPHGGVGTVRIFVDGEELKVHLPMGYDFELRAIDEMSFDVAVPGRSISMRFQDLGRPEQGFSWQDEDGDEEPVLRRLEKVGANVLEAYAGTYRAADLLDSVPLVIRREGERLFMYWGTLQTRQEVFRVSRERLTTYSDKMQCNLVFTFDELGRANGFTYEGHRVWNLRFDRAGS